MEGAVGTMWLTRGCRIRKCLGWLSCEKKEKLSAESPHRERESVCVRERDSAINDPETSELISSVNFVCSEYDTTEHI